jgi:hypothetical protein
MPTDPPPTDSGPKPSPAILPGVRPEDLPQVVAPSAFFILQLFVIPAMIVAAVITIWALFGKLAESDTNWQQMVEELGSSNEHRRWRAAHGLAQLLGNERNLPTADDRIPLTREPVIIQGLTDVLKKSLASTTPSDEDLEHQKFLTRTLSMMEDDDTVLPVLATAMTAERNPEVRKSALMAVAAIAGRHFEKATGFESDAATQDIVPVALREPLQEPTITNTEILQQVQLASQDPDPVVRHLAAYASASIRGSDSVELLKTMLSDGDTFARANAAVGLARNGSVDGVPVLTDLLKEATRPFDQTASYESPEAARVAYGAFQVEQSAVTRNCLRAVGGLWDRLTTEQKANLKAAIQKIEADHFAADVRNQASSFLREHP